MDEIIELVNKLRMEHYVCEGDCWYSCPKARSLYDPDRTACCDDSQTGCNCGADEHNKIVDEVIARLREEIEKHDNELTDQWYEGVNYIRYER